MSGHRITAADRNSAVLEGASVSLLVGSFRRRASCPVAIELSESEFYGETV